METASTLSKTQISKSLSGKVKKPTLKTSLCSPYVAAWPSVDAVVQQFILNRIKMLIEDCKPKDLVSTSGEKRKKKKKKMKNSELKVRASTPDGITLDPLKSRSSLSLIVGLQNVMRCLERDELRLVVVDRSSPWQLHRHLVQLSAVRGCPAVAIDHVADNLCATLSVTQLAAFAFKKCPEGDENDTLSTTIADIADKCPAIELPWLPCQQSLNDIKQEKAAQLEASSLDFAAAIRDKNKRLDDECKTEEASPDYHHLYIYKSDKAKTVDKNFTKEQNFIPFSQTSDSDDDNVHGETFRCNVVKREFCDDKGGRKRKFCDDKLRGSLYKKANLGKMQANTNGKNK